MRGDAGRLRSVHFVRVDERDPFAGGALGVDPQTGVARVGESRERRAVDDEPPRAPEAASFENGRMRRIPDGVVVHDQRFRHAVERIE